MLAELLEDFEPRNIYNADETDIYFRALPDGTLTFSRDKLSGSKSKNPRCFRGVQQLPLPYTNNKNAWMTGDLFRKWLVDFEKDMAK